MKIRNIVAIYSLFIGILMIGMWSMFILTGQVTEIATKPAEIVLHLLAEFITAVLLIGGGIGLLKKMKIGYNLNLVALGMLLYTLIVSTGYYLQKGDLAFLSVFALLFILTLVFLIMSLKKEYEIKLDRLSPE
jgi:peptidoglycan/LPS O-acetylase OafA/YrhL